MGNRATRRGTMHPAALQVWKHPLLELVVSDERLKWILANYPPTDQGRPGIIHCEPQRKARRARDAGNSTENEPRRPESEFPDWRRTREFPGDEDALMEGSAPDEVSLEQEELVTAA